jgi:amphi-Trp domain-containing protein
MAKKHERDVEQHYPVKQFVATLRRLADALEQGEPFRIRVAGERVYVPADAFVSVEHERSDDEEELEFQLKWEIEEAEEEEETEEEGDDEEESDKEDA